MRDRITCSLDRVQQWVEEHEYKAYDPGDGQLSFLRALTFSNLHLERCLTAAVLRSPFNIRPLLGIRPHVSTKGMGYMAWGYVRRYKMSNNEEFATRAVSCFDWLVKHRAPNTPHFCWGNHFTFTTRAGRIPQGEPTIVWSSLIGQAFVDGYQVLNDSRYLDVAASICRWIQELPREETRAGSCLSYVGFKQSSIHNSNLLGAALLARVGAIIGSENFLSTAREAVRYSCTRQLPNGSWFYGELPKYHWIDNFHTGYNLDSLKRYIDSSGDNEFLRQLERGAEYFRRTFFEESGRPRYYDNAVLPVDIQCAAQAIDSLTLFSSEDSASLQQACKVAEWTIEHMQAPDGHFYYRDLGWTKIRTPMLHWGQATMFKALAHLLSRLQHASDGAGELQVDAGGTAQPQSVEP